MTSDSKSSARYKFGNTTLLGQSQQTQKKSNEAVRSIEEDTDDHNINMISASDSDISFYNLIVESNEECLTDANKIMNNKMTKSDVENSIKTITENIKHTMFLMKKAEQIKTNNERKFEIEFKNLSNEKLREQYCCFRNRRLIRIELWVKSMENQLLSLKSQLNSLNQYKSYIDIESTEIKNENINMNASTDKPDTVVEDRNLETINEALMECENSEEPQVLEDNEQKDKQPNLFLNFINFIMFYCLILLFHIKPPFDGTSEDKRAYLKRMLIVFTLILYLNQNYIYSFVSNVYGLFYKQTQPEPPKHFLEIYFTLIYENFYQKSILKLLKNALTGTQTQT